MEPIRSSWGMEKLFIIRFVRSSWSVVHHGVQQDQLRCGMIHHDSIRPRLQAWGPGFWTLCCIMKWGLAPRFMSSARHTGEQGWWTLNDEHYLCTVHTTCIHGVCINMIMHTIECVWAFMGPAIFTLAANRQRILETIYSFYKTRQFGHNYKRCTFTIDG